MNRIVAALLCAVFLCLPLSQGVGAHAHLTLLSEPVTAQSIPFAAQQWNLRHIHAYAAWKIATTQGAGVRVCLVDTGIQQNHPDLAGAFIGGTNTVQPGKSINDGLGHGTWTAGAAVGHGKILYGVAPQASLLVAKAVDDGGGGSTESITAGMAWCIQNGAQVISMSLGSAYDLDDGERELIALGCHSGVNFAVAAGNSSNQIPFDPASIRSRCLITVNASNSRDELASFSNYSENSRELTAPGAKVLGDWPTSTVSYASGTSMSTPQTAGAMALLRGMGASAKEAVAYLLKTARHPKNYHQLTFGAGLLDVAAACKAYQLAHSPKGI